MTPLSSLKKQQHFPPINNYALGFTASQLGFEAMTEKHPECHLGSSVVKVNCNTRTGYRDDVAPFFEEKFLPFELCFFVFVICLSSFVRNVDAWDSHK
jgi:hypothetical protein